MNHLAAYYQLEKLPCETRQKWNIKSKIRLDCVSHYDSLGSYQLSLFVNQKGQMYFYLNVPENYVKADIKRTSDIGLTHGSHNLSSIYVPDIELPDYGYGDYGNHCLLFKIGSELDWIEMYLVQNAKYLKSQYFQRFIDGDFDCEIQHVKEKAVPFFDY